MAIALYMDAHIPRAMTLGLRLRGVDVITAQEDNAADLPDSTLLDRATALQRVLFTFDDDLLAEATRRQIEGIPFAGVIYAHPSRVSIGTCICDIELIAKVGKPKDLVNRTEFLPF
ncbi:DUF5615 family PIN-like protein [Dehalococcoidia bacterium]|nr:DUF5615 family PIN-like protein [Dehalococcoidia bacterium]MCL0066044.1 DUF5615 family PIN-like protein [Dehalococcoidia bacterium]MCL0074502.1 DUF5615 family PIN-like protein [Dehalococcoidia bacterium]MCL0088695.1 DUF5615 family PIN-like protein [Dehalococcoidia bacterium]